MRHLCRCRGLLFAALALAVPCTASAQDQDAFRLKVGGVYNAWFQNQQDFFLGQQEYDDRYIVQMLRFNVSVGYGDYIRAVTRVDVAQGWWGVDNDDWRADQDADDNPTASARFGRKDTNYGPHVDIGYLEFFLPKGLVVAAANGNGNGSAQAPAETRPSVRVGRMYYGLGNKLVLDSNFDGVQVDVPVPAGKLGFGYAKVSEGADATTDLDLSGNGGVDAEDADLLYATFDGKAAGGAFSYGLFGMYYNDRSDGDGTTFMPNGIDYFRARFTPNISKLTALGLTASYAIQPLGLTLAGEFDYLTGEDNVANANSGPNQLLDINNGDLSGYNLYLKATKSLGPKVDLGLVFGRGSGDDDLTGGAGNANKLKTMGFFYLTEVWEESIMPDEEGITPQGLGAPNTRGYRELENTTAFQGSLTFRPAPKWRAQTSYSYLRATEPIRGWGDADGNGRIEASEFTAESSRDIGSEVDFLIGYKPYPRLDLVLRGGYMWAGDATRLLINGNKNTDTNPWELKGVVEFTF